MALRTVIKTEGKSIIETNFGSIENGVQSISFSAYVKVESIIGDKKQISVNVSFVGDNIRFTKHYCAPVSLENGAPNFIAQAYEHLKTLPEFADATDC
jgi:hypothetical protein